MEKAYIIAIIIWGVILLLGLVTFLALYISSKKEEKRRNKNAKHHANKK